ncbi:hypothetical protein BCR41DRAFT_233246 [Lobosporangium transversale]|uniref:Uncharacterized protein n=1 Tax=Lobosporangium transversale TaxID=64571 RepID=A0A1Y2GUL2_9FUNG|nr:hypothetical protein BCR41DRAFT_233246 [Lobosporangium transversale]ORZ24762.1 hypothetical protein BCR41DRAFT_233246 [Lobosporangium transversale]|eukprot:XP_021883743.1 hypothetical protein BCR41DRAFT_233246 [Lobosporangium transversale]
MNHPRVFEVAEIRLLAKDRVRVFYYYYYYYYYYYLNDALYVSIYLSINISRSSVFTYALLNLFVMPFLFTCFIYTMTYTLPNFWGSFRGILFIIFLGAYVSINAMGYEHLKKSRERAKRGEKDRERERER